jgi:glucosamine--fructose-6-phosphate aminotransferase (isomerizing)
MDVAEQGGSAQVLNMSFEVVEGQYFRDLMDQPQGLDATHAYLREPGRWDRVSQFFQSRRWKRVLLTGMGSSFHSLHPLQLALFDAGLAPLLIETSELIHYGTNLFGEETLIVAVSQSGRSAEMLRLLECKRESRILAVTNTADSPLAEVCDCLLSVRAGIEATVSCKTYVSGLLALAWLAELMSGGAERNALKGLAPACDVVAAYLKHWRAHTESLAVKLSGTRHLFLVGRGTSLAAAATGGLIIKESAHFHAEGMSSASFRHGPMEMLQSEVQTIVFGGDTGARRLNDLLLRDLIAKGGSCDIISEDAAYAPFRLAHCAPVLRPIVEILPVQMMSLALAALSGREAGRFQFASKITATE